MEGTDLGGWGSVRSFRPSTVRIRRFIVVSLKSVDCGFKKSKTVITESFGGARTEWTVMDAKKTFMVSFTQDIIQIDVFLVQFKLQFISDIENNMCTQLFEIACL